MKNKFWLFSLLGLLFSVFAKGKRRCKEMFSYTPKPSGRKTITYTPINRSGETDRNTDEWTQDGAG